MTSCHSVPFTMELGSERRRPPAAPGKTRAARWALTFVARLPGQAHAGGVDPEATASTTEMRAALIRETAHLLRLRTSASPATTSSSTAPSASTPSTWAAAPCTAARRRDLHHPRRVTAPRPAFLPFADGDPQDRRDRVEDTPARARPRDQGPHDPRAAAPERARSGRCAHPVMLAAWPLGRRSLARPVCPQHAGAFRQGAASRNLGGRAWPAGTGGRVQRLI